MSLVLMCTQPKHSLLRPLNRTALRRDMTPDVTLRCSCFLLPPPPFPLLPPFLLFCCFLTCSSFTSTSLSSPLSSYDLSISSTSRRDPGWVASKARSSTKRSTAFSSTDVPLDPAVPESPKSMRHRSGDHKSSSPPFSSLSSLLVSSSSLTAPTFSAASSAGQEEEGRDFASPTVAPPMPSILAGGDLWSVTTAFGTGQGGGFRIMTLLVVRSPCTTPAACMSATSIPIDLATRRDSASTRVVLTFGNAAPSSFPLFELLLARALSLRRTFFRSGPLVVDPSSLPLDSFESMHVTSPVISPPKPFPVASASSISASSFCSSIPPASPLPFSLTSSPSSSRSLSTSSTSSPL
mmetsp:Transcript_50231/g.151212  ORF Transcript_50231/g.151212 Transcript_50231/m.151212 type:complete len:351 (-) Transcript_50231:83-1135(-)